MVNKEKLRAVASEEKVQMTSIKLTTSLLNHRFQRLIRKDMSYLLVELLKWRKYDRVGGDIPKPHLERACMMYIRDVTQELGELCGWCIYMETIPAFLSDLRIKKEFPGSGMEKRTDYIVYHLENYFLRVSGIYDRILKLVNAVFNLGYAPLDCRAITILRNKRLTDTSIPRKLKALSDVIEKYRPLRNVIAHHKMYSDEQINYIKLIERKAIEKPRGGWNRSILTKLYIDSKSRELSEFNKNLFKRIEGVFDEFIPVYIHECAYLNAEEKINGIVSKERRKWLHKRFAKLPSDIMAFGKQRGSRKLNVGRIK